MMTGFKIYCLTNFQIYNTVSLTLVAMLYIISPGLIYSVTGRLYFLTVFTQQSVFSIWSPVLFSFILFFGFMHEWDHIVFFFLGLKWVFPFQISIKNLLQVFKSQETTYYYPLYFTFVIGIFSVL